jgi:predicted helicase
VSDTVKDYLKKVEKELQSENTTEHSLRPHLKSLIESFDKTILAINEPKRVKCGAPDYVIVKNQTPVGYIEAKGVGVSLDNEEKSEQLSRYRSSLSNLILTDYLEFRWYVGGEHRLTVRIGESALNRVTTDGEGIKKLPEMINSFLTVQVPTVGNPKELAKRMAALARLTREAIEQALADDDAGGVLRNQMEGFREALLHDLTEEQFADMYAQTICYGLFAARCNSDTPSFTREHAAYDLPKTNPFLRKMFSHIAGPDLDDRVVWVVDDLAELLRHSDMSAILQDFGKRTRQEDPVVHFYETFLSAYDPKMREMRGVYYTPEPVVSYIVRSVDQILKRDFGLAHGLADASKITVKKPDDRGEAEFHKVQILDPACGTGTFLHGVVDQIYESFRGNEGMWPGYVSEHLLPRLWGFELLMAPYAVAHMKLGLQLKETGYDFRADERLGVYLTNTLEEAHGLSRPSPFAQWIADEANAAGRVKSDVPVMVVLGNPPYSNFGMMNQGIWIRDLMADYKKDLHEKKWNEDDYMKFMRFGQWRINRTGQGILALITNRSYLDAITRRRMRQSLMETFNHIYILDLHGDSNIKEVASDGSPDENVFDIQQGVAIGIFVKKLKSKAPSKVYQADLWGKRKSKYSILSENDIMSTVFQEVPHLATNEEYHFFFTKKSFEFIDEYNSYFPIRGAFAVDGPGIHTERDRVSIHFAEDQIREAVRDFRESDESSLRNKYHLTKDSRDWSVAKARADVMLDRWNDMFTPILYRPFDLRYTWYSGQSRGFIGTPGYRVMRNLSAGDSRINIALVGMRQYDYNVPDYCYFFVTKEIVDHRIFVSARGSATIFPLYVFLPGSEPKSFANHTLNLPSRVHNFQTDFINHVAAKVKMTFVEEGQGDLINAFGPEDLFNYIYAVFHAPAYRERYAEFMKIDFPRVPITSQQELFRSLSSYGNDLISMHLLDREESSAVRFPMRGDNDVEKITYKIQDRVFINSTQFFEGVPPEVWDFHIGGYQVCAKWLKDRKGRKLSFDDLEHYQKIVSALAETIRIMTEIDSVIESHGGFPIK